MPKSKLKPEILDLLVEITKLDKKSVIEKVSRKKSSNLALTSNAAAYLIAKEHGRTITGRLNDEDRIALKDFQAQPTRPVSVVSRAIQNIRSNRNVNRGKSNKKPLINYQSTNANAYFVNEHIRELTDAYYAGCYTAVFILFRKIVENLIIDLLKAKFPNRIELVFSIGQRRYHDFSVVLQNLYDERKAFSHDGEKAIERLYGLLTPFKKDANDKAHSWFHIVKSPDEVDKDSKLAPIIAVVIILEKDVGLRT